MLALRRAHAAAAAPEGVIDYLEADLREPGKILAEAAQTLDFSRPVAIMLIAVLHLILDRDDPYDLVGQLVDAVVPGSYVVISHAASDLDTGAMISMTNRLNEMMAQRAVPRTHREVAAFFAGLDLVRARPGAHPGMAPRLGQRHGRPGPDVGRHRP